MVVYCHLLCVLFVRMCKCFCVCAVGVRSVRVKSLTQTQPNAFIMYAYITYNYKHWTHHDEKNIKRKSCGKDIRLREVIAGRISKFSIGLFILTSFDSFRQKTISRKGKLRKYCVHMFTVIIISVRVYCIPVYFKDVEQMGSQIFGVNINWKRWGVWVWVGKKIFRLE